MISYVLAIICSIAVLAADQLTKYFIVSNFELGQSVKFIEGFIDIVYIHNRGAAWGMLNGYTWILLSLTTIVLLVCITMLFKIGTKNKLMFWATILIMSGGIGNLIDRIFRSGNVVDFLHFEFFPTFPIFNIADCAIVIGAGLLILYFLIETINEAKLKRKNSQREINVTDENG